MLVRKNDVIPKRFLR